MYREAGGSGGLGGFGAETIALKSNRQVYVTVAGDLIALAETGQGQIVPKRVFNLAGLTGSAGKEKGY